MSNVSKLERPVNTKRNHMLERSRRKAVTAEFARIADKAFSAAFEEMFELSARVTPNGSSKHAIHGYLRAMRGCLEQRERATTVRS